MNFKKAKIGYVYCLWSFDFLWRYKVGYSASPDVRLADIQQSIRNEYGQHIRVSRAIKMPMLFAYQFEQAIFKSLFWRPVPDMQGSGKTEWSYWVNIVSAVLAWILAYGLGNPCPHYIAAVVLFLPFPLDYCIFILAFALFQYLVLIAGAYFLLLKLF